VRGPLELVHVGVAVVPEHIEAGLGVNAVLEVHKARTVRGWAPRDGTEGASRSAQP